MKGEDRATLQMFLMSFKCSHFIYFDLKDRVTEKQRQNDLSSPLPSLPATAKAEPT